MLCLGVAALIITIAGTICYNFSVGINPIIDIVSAFGLITGLFISILVMILTGCSFFYFLIRRRFKQVLFCIFLCLFMVLITGIIMPAMGVISPRGHKIICSVNIQIIGKALNEYAIEYDGILPPDWCDVLILDYDLPASYLYCKSARPSFAEGESSYALNENVIGKKLSELLTDTVILFETDYIGSNPEKMIPLGQREFASEDNLYIFEEKEVREGAWNQVGGVDIVTYSHHTGLGCNILFADGHVEFVKKKDISKLRWKP